MKSILDVYEEQVIMKTTRPGVHLRFYKPTIDQSPYVVQQITNLGVRDGRLKQYKREWKKILIKTHDRSEAVAVFNNKLTEFEKEKS